MNGLEVALGVLAGLVLFLYGVARLADGLRHLAGDRARAMLARFTTNRLLGVLAGAAVCTMLDSSSVTIVLVIALVHARALTFEQSLGVILGANIGTTVSSQLIAFDIAAYAPLALAIGAGLHLLGRGPRAKVTGTVIFGLGLVFFGLGYIEQAVEPLKESAGFDRMMVSLERPALGVLAGALTTIVIQSSSATLGIVISLGAQGLVTLPAAIAVMLGAEIGTCADTLVATAGRSRDAMRAGIFHLLFNVASVLVGVALIERFTMLVTAMAASASLERQIANAHVLFNVLGVLAVIGFLPTIARLLRRLIPDRAAAPMRQPTLATS